MDDLPHTAADHRVSPDSQHLPALPPTNRRHRASPRKARVKFTGNSRTGRNPVKKKVRIALCAEKETLREYLSRLLESYGIDVRYAVGLDIESLDSLDRSQFDVLLVDREEQDRSLQSAAAARLANWDGPVLYNDAVATEISLQQGNPDFGQSLAQRIHSLAGAALDTDSVKRKVH